jgi:methylmalonyl-CoA mutase cobalamin-binding subunit
MIEIDLRHSLADHLRSVASWRRSRYQDDLRDPRNLVSAAGLEDFADWVVTLPADDPRLTALARYAAVGTSFTPGQQALYEIGRFRFFQPETEFDAFLDQLVQLAEADHNENGRFGGRQVPGDEPW